MVTAYSVALFSNGTLRLEAVQMKSFGRRLTGTDDAMPGFRTETIEITGPDVISISGERFHSIVSPSGDPNDEVKGTLFFISDEELDAADKYEVSDYMRVEVRLKSGTMAWVYVKA